VGVPPMDRKQDIARGKCGDDGDDARAALANLRDEYCRDGKQKEGDVQEGMDELAESVGDGQGVDEQVLGLDAAIEWTGR